MDEDGNILSENDEGVKVFDKIKARELWNKIINKNP